MRARSIRWHLFQVLVLSIFPIGLFAAGLLYLHWQAQERERERAQIQSVRLLAAAVDNALDSTVQRMAIFAGLWAANPASDAVIHAQARNALAANPDWSNILAFRADGTAVFRANEPFGTAMPEMKLVPQWQEVIIQRRPMVSDVFVSPDQGAKVVSVGVPVMRNGQVTHVLVARLNLRWFDELVTRQGRGGVAGIFDRNWKFVARGAEGEERRGTDPSQPLIEDIKRNPEGIGKYTNLNGTAVYTAWTASRHGWWVALATPSAPVESAFWLYLGALGALWAMLLAAGVAYAVAKGRHIAGALESVKARASELAASRAPSGTPSALPASRVDEVSQALEALEQASVTLQSAMRARDQSLETERQARAAAEAASRAKDEFLALLGHELRNPLAAIWSAVAVVRSDRHTREQLDFAAGVIERQSRHLKRLIDDLLDVGRVMTGKVMLERAPLDLAAAARYVVATLETAGRFAQRRLEVDTEPAWVDADHTRLEQLITNLLINAVTYSAAGGRVRVRVAREGDEAVLEVSDDGRGIAPEHLERVFELFFQADPAADRASGGLGMGLTVVQRLVGMHGGKVSARSAGPGQGATFEVRLPAVEAGAQRALAPAPSRGAVAHEILLVEDNQDERETLRVALELEGHRVHAADGIAALELLLRHRPRVAILDIALPGIDGYQLARQARAASGPHLLLIALTGYGGTVDLERAQQAGFDFHLTKPVDVRELLKLIARAPAPAEARVSAPAGLVRPAPIGQGRRGP